MLSVSLSALLSGCGDGYESRESAAGRGEAFEGTSIAAPTGSAAISTRGLVAAYDFSTYSDDGLLTDLSGNGLHGTPVIRSTGPGVFGDAQVFELVGHRIRLPADPAFDLDGPLTIAVWVRVDEPGLHQHIAACDDKWALWVTPADQYRLGDTRGGGWSSAEGSIAAGVWTPVVAVLRGTRGDPLTPETVGLYVDGDLAAAEAHLRTDEAREVAAWNPGELYPADACHLGFESHQGDVEHQDMPFVGAIDELLVFSRAWTEEEVRAFSVRGGGVAER